MSAQSQRQLDPRWRQRFQRRLLGWYEKNERDLPWRRTTDPYKIWVAEVMLQQTTVTVVIPYYGRFLQRFPTVQDLANAPIDEVLRLWAGLGYYARARHLHKAAQQVVQRLGGRVPQSLQELRTLPGIGRYTAGAILSIAFNQDVPLLDGNVTRVLCRVFHITGNPKSPQAQKRLWALAEELIPAGKARAFNQAMMELGALVCVSSAPRCEVCPLSVLCEARRLGKQEELPEPTRKAPVKEVEDAAALIRPPAWGSPIHRASKRPMNGATTNRYLIVQRPLDGLWGGLWEFPRGTRRDGETLPACLRRTLRELLGVKVKVGRLVAIFPQAVEHRRMTLHYFECALTDGTPRPLGCTDWKWATLDEVLQHPLSSAQRKVVEELKKAL